jgi:hypothetical protein
VSCGGDFTLSYTAGSQPQASTIDLAAGAVLAVGDDFTASAVEDRVFSPADELGILRFTGGGAIVITALDEYWPIIEFTGGGTCTLPAGFNCHDLRLFNGTLTAAGALTIRNAYNGSLGTSLTLGGSLYIGSSFVNLGTVVTLGSDIRVFGAVCSLSGLDPDTLTMTTECIRLQLLTAMTISTLTIDPRPSPGVIQFLAGGAYAIGTLNAAIGSPDGPVQLISSVAGTRYSLNVTIPASIAFLWPRDCDASGGAALAADLTNKDLGNNLGWTGLPNGGQLALITDDPGQDMLAAAGYGKYQYCWFVDTSVALLNARVAAFAAGTNNWHRKSVLPLGFLDNLNIGVLYYCALGLVDERDRRLAPAPGDAVAVYATSGGAGGARNITFSTQFASVSG